MGYDGDTAAVGDTHVLDQLLSAYIVRRLVVLWQSLRVEKKEKGSEQLKEARGTLSAPSLAGAA